MESHSENDGHFLAVNVSLQAHKQDFSIRSTESFLQTGQNLGPQISATLWILGERFGSPGISMVFSDPKWEAIGGTPNFPPTNTGDSFRNFWVQLFRERSGRFGEFGSNISVQHIWHPQTKIAWGNQPRSPQMVVHSKGSKGNSPQNFREI